jgi:hypothetical protein
VGDEESEGRKYAKKENVVIFLGIDEVAPL